MDKRDRLAWMDLVVMGIHPDRTCTVELAFSVTDGELALIAEGPSVRVRESLERLGAIDDLRHARAPGADDLAGSDTPVSSLAEAESTCLAFLTEHCPDGGPPLAGVEISRDRRFLRRAMKQLDGFLHYRIIDVATVEELVRRWYPDAYAARPGPDSGPEAMPEAMPGAKAGIRQAIATLRYFRQSIFVAPPTEPSGDR